MTTTLPNPLSDESNINQIASLQTPKSPIQQSQTDTPHLHWLMYASLCMIGLYISYRMCSNAIPLMRSYIHKRESILYNGVAYSPVTYITKKIENPKDPNVIILGHDLMVTLPEESGNLKIHLFLIDSNPITSLPDSIGSIQSLERLGITNTNLQTIPSSLGSITNLKYLYIQGNRISRLPDSFSSLQNLEAINLAYNKLSELPSSMKSLMNVSVLDLTGNNFTTFPANLPPNLEVLYIGGNHISLKQLDEAQHRFALTGLVIYY